MEKTKRKTKYFVFLLIFFVFVSFAGGLFVGLTANYRLTPFLNLNEAVSSLSGQTPAVNFNLFKQVWEKIQEKYVDQPLDEQAMLYGALSGLVASLDDPYSAFLDPSLTLDFMAEIRGSFEGIGAEIGIKNDQLVIIAPLKDSPAERAGLKAKDVILEIDGVDTGSLSLTYATALIRGEKGSEVKLLIGREDLEQPREISIVRDTIVVQSVDWRLIDSGGQKIGYLEINNFNSDTENRVQEAANYFKLNNPEGLILDLRDNSGGYLDVCIKVASQFISEGLILSEQFSDGEVKNYYAEGKAVLSGYPMIVLINGGTASASEILAGALSEYGLATLVGEKTFGKGSVQEYEELSGGSSLKITTARWFTPEGNSIDHNGIEPDILIPLTKEDFDQDRDPQLEKGLALLSEKTEAVE